MQGKVSAWLGIAACLFGDLPNMSHSLAASAAEGVSARTKLLVVTTAAKDADSKPAVFAPYIDMGLASSETLLTAQRDPQIKLFTLAFVLSQGGCSAGWQGVGAISNDILPSGRTILSLIQSLRATGSDVIISFGGANGDEPALHCPDPARLAAVYQSVINRYDARALDFDIEGDKILDQASLQRRNLALISLRAANPGLTISYTLPVLPSGLDDNGVDVLVSAKRDGFDPDVVNVMAMNYGALIDNGGQMGRNAITAASNTAQQVKAAGLTSRIGVIPMIGVNDVPTEVFTLADAHLLTTFVTSNPYIARLSMWSVGRDNGSCAGAAAADPNCSGIGQVPYAFSEIFQER